ncbi:hypothetical protein BDW71DRAFT_205869 [Aspergillus fruticulosus]
MDTGENEGALRIMMLAKYNSLVLTTSEVATFKTNFREQWQPTTPGKPGMTQAMNTPDSPMEIPTLRVNTTSRGVQDGMNRSCQPSGITRSLGTLAQDSSGGSAAIAQDQAPRDIEVEQNSPGANTAATSSSSDKVCGHEVDRKRNPIVKLMCRKPSIPDSTANIVKANTPLDRSHAIHPLNAIIHHILSGLNPRQPLGEDSGPRPNTRFLRDRDYISWHTSFDGSNCNKHFPGVYEADGLGESKSPSNPG